MLYYTVLLERKPDLSQDAFERLWLGDHLSMASELPGLVSASFYPRADLPSRTDQAGGFGYLCFPDAPSLEHALASGAGRALGRHTSLIADTARTTRVVAREPVRIDLASDGSR